LKNSNAEKQSEKQTESRLAISSRIYEFTLYSANLSYQSFSVKKPFLWESSSAKSCY